MGQVNGATSFLSEAGRESDCVRGITASLRILPDTASRRNNQTESAALSASCICSEMLQSTVGNA